MVRSQKSGDTALVNKPLIQRKSLLFPALIGQKNQVMLGLNGFQMTVTCNPAIAWSWFLWFSQ